MISSVSAVALLVLVVVISTAEHRHEKPDRSESTLDTLTQPATLPPQDNGTCPTWFLPATDDTGNDTCKCGNKLDGIVHCDNATQQVYLHRCYCMSYNQDMSALVVGNCDYSCYHTTVPNSPYFCLPSNASELTHYARRTTERVNCVASVTVTTPHLYTPTLRTVCSALSMTTTGLSI